MRMIVTPNGIVKPPQPVPSIQTTEMVVSPQQAQQWLDAQGINRRLNRNHVEALKREIIGGHWVLTHQGIAFDENGNLVDGQHRLAAIVESGIPVRMLVSTGVLRDNAMSAVDQGRIRTRGQLFGMRQESYADKKAAACRVINVMLTPNLNYTSSLGPRADSEVLEEFRPYLEKAIDTGKLPAAYVGVMALCFKYIPALAETFHQGVSTGANLEENDPRLLLREFLLRPYKQGSLGSSSFVSKILKITAAVDAFMNGEKLKRLTPSPVRYLRFCEKLGIPINSTALAYAKSTKR